MISTPALCALEPTGSSFDCQVRCISDIEEKKPKEKSKCDCGHSLSLERIVNGEAVINPGTYPWQVILIVNGRFTCGGSLISPDFVLTAAHCVYKYDSENVIAILGRHNYSQFYNEPNEQKRSVSKIHIHPDFNVSMLNNDVALLQLEAEVELTDFVSSVCLPNSEEEDFAHVWAIASGWG